MTALQVINCTLGSVDEFSAFTARAGWATDFRQLDRGREEVRLQLALSTSSILMRVDLSNRVHQQAVPPAGCVTFGIPTHLQAPGKFGRRILDSETLTCFDPAAGLNVVSAPGFGAYTLAFKSRRLSELAQILDCPDPTDSTRMLGLQRYPSGIYLARLRFFLEGFFATAPSCGETMRENALRDIESDLPMEILKAWTTAIDTPYVPASSRARALRRAMEYIRSRPQVVLSVEELCRESASSISTLERAFREHFAVSPKQYLTASRLTGVRRTLLNPGETRNIGDIAANWGFWHLSKFAADYKRMFGESPSATRPVS